MLAGKTSLPVNTPVIITKSHIEQKDAVNYAGLTGRLTHPFITCLTERQKESCIAGIHVSEESQKQFQVGKRINLLLFDEFEIRYPVEQPNEEELSLLDAIQQLHKTVAEGYSVHLSVKRMLQATNPDCIFSIASWRFANEFVFAVNAAIPPMCTETFDENIDGHPHHSFSIGREYKPVIYVHIVDSNLKQPFYYAELHNKLHDIAKGYNATEFEVKYEEGSHSYRFYFG